MMCDWTEGSVLKIYEARQSPDNTGWDLSILVRQRNTSELVSNREEPKGEEATNEVLEQEATTRR